MKKLLIILVLCLYLAGCGAAAKNSGFYEHDSLYKDWGHLWFSWYGHRHCPSADEAQQMAQKGWWGLKRCTLP